MGWHMLCETVSLSFLTYLRHSLIGFNENLMTNQLGRKWKVGLPGREKGTLGRKRKGLLSGNMGGVGPYYRPEKYSLALHMAE